LCSGMILTASEKNSPRALRAIPYRPNPTRSKAAPAISTAVRLYLPCRSITRSMTLMIMAANHRRPLTTGIHLSADFSSAISLRVRRSESANFPSPADCLNVILGFCHIETGPVEQASEVPKSAPISVLPSRSEQDLLSHEIELFMVDMGLVG